MVSVIIPNRNSPFAKKTVDDLLANAEGEIEIIVHVDEHWPEITYDKRVIYIHPGTSRGMRSGINAGLSVARGDYIMKTDDHCMFAPGFDTKLARDCAEDWLVIPRRYSLDAENWKINETRPIRDYHYLCFPKKDKEHDWGMHGVEWPERTKERFNDARYDIDDTMSFQGSCWFANRRYFMKTVGFMDDSVDTYSTFAQEPQEIGLKYWLKGGANKINKKVWYAHLHKGRQYGRMYKEDHNTVASHNWSAKHWMNNEEPGIIHPISWLVEKFWPVPTWPEDRALWVSPI